MTAHLVPQSPLMHSVGYQGQVYFTSQYFHAEYVRNSPNGGKYRRHPDFLRVLRAIPAYQLYHEQADILEVTWNAREASNDAVKPEWLCLKPLFQAAGYRPLTLLNDVAQLALSHHLDDLISQQMSVAVNTHAARQARQRQGLLPEEHADRALQAHLHAASLLGVPTYRAQQEAVKMVQATTGIDYRPLLSAAPAQDHITEAEKRYEPTELAEKLGQGKNKGRAMNLVLQQLGWQIRAIGGGWEPTPAGKPHCDSHAWQSEYGTKSGFNLKWSLPDVQAALTAQHAQVTP